jgi:hypothetical protein
MNVRVLLRTRAFYILPAIIHKWWTLRTRRLSRIRDGIVPCTVPYVLRGGLCRGTNPRQWPKEYRACTLCVTTRDNGVLHKTSWGVWTKVLLRGVFFVCLKTAPGTPFSIALCA